MNTEKELQNRASHLMQAAREAKDPQLRSRLIASATFMAHQARGHEPAWWSHSP
jgi:hypothetical protein